MKELIKSKKLKILLYAVLTVLLVFSIGLLALVFLRQQYLSKITIQRNRIVEKYELLTESLNNASAFEEIELKKDEFQSEVDTLEKLLETETVPPGSMGLYENNIKYVEISRELSPVIDSIPDTITSDGDLDSLFVEYNSIKDRLNEVP